MPIQRINPFFIIGTNRSGTTLLRLILNAHSQIAIPDEVDYFKWVNNNSRCIKHWRHLKISSVQYKEFVAKFLESRTNIFPDVNIAKLKDDITEAEQFDFKKPYEMALEALAQSQGKQRWGEKTPSNLFFIDILSDMFPHAKFIHIVRDPRAVVNSLNEPMFWPFPNDSVINALNWRRQVNITCLSLDKFVAPENKIFIKYENLVNSPLKTIECICDFLNEKFEEKMLLWHKDCSSYMKQKAQIFNRNAVSPLNRNLIEKWKNKLSHHEIAAIESICRKEMLNFGYEMENLTLKPSGKLEVILSLAAYNWHCWRNRNRRGLLMHQKAFSRFRK
jgi:hypothetical protein